MTCVSGLATSCVKQIEKVGQIWYFAGSFHRVSEGTLRTVSQLRQKGGKKVDKCVSFSKISEGTVGTFPFRQASKSIPKLFKM